MSECLVDTNAAMSKMPTSQTHGGAKPALVRLRGTGSLVLVSVQTLMNS